MCARIIRFAALSALCVAAFASGADERPPLVRGVMTVHFPLGALPADSAGRSFFWIPIPEMGFEVVPTMPFPTGGGWWEFPIHILTLFPFLDKYGSLGDVSIGAGFRVPPIYCFCVSYRFLGGRFYPMDGRFYAHVVGAEIALPIRGFSAAGASLDWVVASNLDLGAPYTRGGKSYDHYEGSAFAIAPYWRFELRYGVLRVSYRVVVSSRFSATSTQTQTSYSPKTRSVSAFELRYEYP